VIKATVVPNWRSFKINQGRGNPASPLVMQSPSQPTSTVPFPTVKRT